MMYQVDNKKLYYTVHYTKEIDGKKKLIQYYSYAMPVAQYSEADNSLMICEKGYYSGTTTKHCNEIKAFHADAKIIELDGYNIQMMIHHFEDNLM